MDCLSVTKLLSWKTSAAGWSTVKDIKTKPSGLGTHFADLLLKGVEPGHAVVFTFFWPESGQWENVDFTVRVGEQVDRQLETEF